MENYNDSVKNESIYHIPLSKQFSKDVVFYRKKENIANLLFQKLIFYSFQDEANQLLEKDYVKIPIYNKMLEAVVLKRKIHFILPAFPAKSPNPFKTNGHLPDMGEVLALKALQKLMNEMSDLHHPGVELLICSDGRAFSDVVGVSDARVDDYLKGLKNIIHEFELKKISVMSMDDLYPEVEGEELRQRLLRLYAKSIEEVRMDVLSNVRQQKIFNGMHRFILEDRYQLMNGISKNQVSKESKRLTYELIRRSDAWSSLISSCYKDSLRLSIHPHSLQSEKFGIKLVSSSQKWGTPWHNATLFDGVSFQLVHYGEILKLKAKTCYYKDQYVYYKV